MKHTLSILAAGAAIIIGMILAPKASAQGMFSHESGVYTTTQLVRIEGEVVYYTTDGTEPTAESALYDGKPIVVTQNTVIRTAVMTGDTLTKTDTLEIKIRARAPKASVSSGTYTESQTVTLSGTKGSTIYYTTDGSRPTKKSAKYTEPITVDKTTTLRFMAAKKGMANSAVVTRIYKIAKCVYDEPERSELFELVNEVRAEYELAPLEELPELSEIAQKRAKECSAYFSHWRADGTKWDNLLAEAGLKRSVRAENICYYHLTARQALDSWLADSAHRNNILNPDVKYIGIGYYYNGYCSYWTQLFIGE